MSKPRFIFFLLFSCGLHLWLAFLIFLHPGQQTGPASTSIRVLLSPLSLEREAPVSTVAPAARKTVPSSSAQKSILTGKQPAEVATPQPPVRDRTPAESTAMQLLLNREHFVEQDMRRLEQRKYGDKIEDALLRRSRGQAGFDPNTPLDVLPEGELSAARNHGNGFCTALASPAVDSGGAVGIKIWRCKPKPLFRPDALR